MNLRAVLLPLAAAATLLSAAEPNVEFAGVMTVAGKTRIALTDLSTKTTTWVEAGQNYRGYTVTRYDPKEEVVFLKNAGRETRLALVSARTTEAARGGTAVASAASTAAPDTTTTAIRANLGLLAAAARQYQQQTGASTVAFSDLVGPDKMIKDLRPVAGENYSTLSFGPNVTGVNVTTASGNMVALELPLATRMLPSAATFANQPTGTPASATGINASADAGAALPATGSTTPGAGTTISAGPTGTGATASTLPGVSAPAAPSPGSEPLQPTGRPPVAPTYTIQGGDTWEKISTATGISVQQLKQMNPAFPEGSNLPAGQAVRTR